MLRTSAVNHPLARTSAFIVALAFSGAVAVALRLLGVGETLSLIAAWIAFFFVGTGIVRLQQRRELRH
jgi:hypothetical protein